MTERKTYFIIKQAGMSPEVKMPPGDDDAFARELIAYYPEGTAIIRLRCDGAAPWAEDAETYLSISDGYKAMAEEQARADADNTATLERIGATFGTKYAQDIKEYLKDAEAPAEFTRLEIVDKPTGRAQVEDWGSFKQVYVQQWSVGCEGDSFDGYICIPLPDGKFLKTSFST